MNFKYKFNLHKRYFETGRGITSDVKYFIALFGAYSVVEKVPLKLTLFLLIAYLIFCYLFGWFWLNKGWYEAEIEVGNQYNQFVKEMRKSYSVSRKL